MQYSDQELEIRYQAIDYVIASQRLEGLELDACTIEDLKCEARGEMTMDEVRAHVFERLKNGEF